MHTPSGLQELLKRYGGGGHQDRHQLVQRARHAQRRPVRAVRRWRAHQRPAWAIRRTERQPVRAKRGRRCLIIRGLCPGLPASLAPLPCVLPLNMRLAPQTPYLHHTRLNRPSARLTTRPSALDVAHRSTQPQQSVPDCALRNTRASLTRRGGCHRLWLITVKFTVATKRLTLTSTTASRIVISYPPGSRSRPHAPRNGRPPTAPRMRRRPYAHCYSLRKAARPSVHGRPALCCAHLPSSSAFTLSMERRPHSFAPYPFLLFLVRAASTPFLPCCTPISPASSSLLPCAQWSCSLCTSRRSRTLRHIEFRTTCTQQKGAKVLNRKAGSADVRMHNAP